MKHLISFSVFQNIEDTFGNDPGAYMHEIGCDGFELFTMMDAVPEVYHKFTISVHLPYAVDWYSAWSGQIDKNDYTLNELDYITFGRDREEISANIRKMILNASEFDPAYGILHGGNTDLTQLYHHNYASDDRKVLSAFTDMLNTAVSGFENGEPPITLALENLWWSGLRLREPWEFKMLEDELEFDNWCLCLDTGHLMNGLSTSYDEDSAIDGTLKVIDGYSKEMIDRIKVMHFHFSESAEYRHTFPEKDISLESGFEDLICDSYAHVSNIDQHKPFTSARCREIVDAIRPDYLTHEMISGNGKDIVSDFIRQRSLLD